MKHRIFKSFSLLTLSLILAVFFAFLLTVLKLNSYTPDQTSIVYDRNGNVIYEIYDEKHRILADSEEFPQSLKQATIAIEDERFYLHPGIDMLAIVRAFKSTVFDGKLQGGSTITQQYVKNAFLTNERTIIRKLEEAWLALTLESTTSKDKILSLYLNEVPYGGVNYGAKTASKYYFNKELSQLSLAESAFLASLTKAPTHLSPQENYKEVKLRQETVLENMQKLGFITQEEKENAQREELSFTYTNPQLHAPHFAMMIVDSVSQEYGKDVVTKGGYAIHTTMDLALQNKVEESIKEELDSLSGYHVTNGASIVIDPKSGAILALAGSKDYFDSTIDGRYNVLLSHRQPGSTFKPILYSLAFQSGYTPATVLLDVQTTYITETERYTPKNYDGKFRGPVTIRQALANSYNIPATRMNTVLEVSSLINHAKKFGIDEIDESQAGISLALGGYEIRPIDLAQAYTVFANEGKLVELNSITKIVDARHSIIYEYKSPEKTQVISPDVSYLITDILADNQARSETFGTNSMLSIPDRKVAVKTGTSNQTRDNWTVGYTPEFVVLTWVGNNDNSPMSNVASGVTGATPIWNKIMNYLLKDKKPLWFEKPGSIVTADIESTTGRKYCNRGSKKEELFIKGTEPKECAQMVASKYVLTEKTPDEEHTIELSSKEQYEQFQNNPIEFINNHKDMFLADEKPAEFTSIKEEYMVKDPLQLKTGQRNVIDLTGKAYSS